jgi:hypothetical protein
MPAASATTLIGKNAFDSPAVLLADGELDRDFHQNFGIDLALVKSWLADRGVALVKPRSEAINELDAAMSLLRAVMAIDVQKLSPRSIRAVARDAVDTALGANGQGADYIFADVYEQIVSMIEPYVFRETRDPDLHPFPASVFETFSMLFEHYLKTNPHLAPVVLDVSPTSNDLLTLEEHR